MEDQEHSKVAAAVSQGQQRLIEPLAAPFLLRPRGDNPEDTRNWIFKAIEQTGQSTEDALVGWVQAFVTHDYLVWRVLEDMFGAREAVIIYSKVWENFAKSLLEHVKQSQKLTKYDMDDLAKLSRAYWEAIGGVYRVVEHSEDHHIAEISTCPYWDNMVDMFGKEKANEMQKKVIGPTSANYYQALIKELGKWDEIYVTQDKFRCLGDDVCRMVYERRKK